MNAGKTTASGARAAGLLFTIGLVLALVGYKAFGAMARLRTGLPPELHTGGTLHRSLLYMKAIWPALVFGVLIASAVRAFFPPALLARILGKGARGQLVASAAATPLMLCSCCAAPLFTGVYETTRKPGPALALMLGAPSLNLAAIAFTFILFGPRLGAARVVMAVFAVLIATAVAGRLAGRAMAAPAATPAAEEPVSLRGFLRALWFVSARTLPAIAVGVLLSCLLAARLSPPALAHGSGPLAAVIVAATVAVPLALPTFFELPLALAMLAGGLPIGAAAAVLFAGPAVNLPSLLTVAREASWRLALAIGVCVWAVAVGGGLLCTLAA